MDETLNQTPTHEQGEQDDPSPQLTDQQIVKALREQREAQGDSPVGELPPLDESGERKPGEIYLTGDNIPVRHIRTHEVGEDKVPIVEDISGHGDRRMSTARPLQLHDDYYVGEGGFANWKWNQVRPRLGEDEARLAADIMKQGYGQSAEALEVLNNAVKRRTEIDTELLRLQTEHDALGDTEEDDRDNETSKHKRDLENEISSLKDELRKLGRLQGEADTSKYIGEYKALDFDSSDVEVNLIDRVYRLNPDYFKDMPTSQFIEIGKEVSELKNKTEGHARGLFDPTDPGEFTGRDLWNIEFQRREKAGEFDDAAAEDAFESRSATYTCVEYLKDRVEAGVQMSAEEIAKTISRYVSLDKFDDDVLSAEDKAAYDAISDGFYDRSPRETYQLYIDMLPKLGDAVKKQLERNAQKYSDFLEDLKSRKPETSQPAEQPTES